MNIEQSDIVW